MRATTFYAGYEKGAARAAPCTTVERKVVDRSNQASKPSKHPELDQPEPIGIRPLRRRVPTARFRSNRSTEAFEAFGVRARSVRGSAFAVEHRQELFARLFAAPARLGANPTMLVLVGVVLAFDRTRPARQDAELQRAPQ